MVAQKIKSFKALFLLGLFYLPGILASCGIARAPQYDYSRRTIKASQEREKIVTDAQSLLGRKYIKIDGRYFNSDCSGLVNAVYYKNGYDVVGPNPPRKQNLVNTIYDNVRQKGKVYRKGLPRPGDIVFFSNTYKKYGTNRFSHAGIVEKVLNDGTVAFIHKTSRGIKRDYINLKKPSKIRSKEGKKLNSYLRRRSKYDSPNVRYLTGELFEAYGSFFD